MLIKELREKMARIATNARAKLNEIKDDTPAERAAEIEREFDTMMAEHDQIEARCARLEKLEKAERSANAADPRRPRGDDGEQRGDDPGNTIEYRTVFAKAMCGGLDDLTPEERAVLKTGRSDVRAQTAGTTTAGGYTVPTELMNQIEISMKATGPMYDPGVTFELRTTSGNSMKLPTVDDTSKTAGAHTEGGTVTDDGSEDVTFGQKSLDAYAFDTEWVKWSWELDMDSIFNMEALLGMLLGERLGRTANSQLTVGTGSSAPNGIVTASGLGVTAASATAITSDEIIDLEHSVDPAYRQSPKAAFMFNDAVLKAIRKLKDGQGNYLWNMGDVTKGVPGTLNGRRYYVNQAMDTIAAAKKVMLFGDLGKYFVRKVGSPITIVARERFAPDLGILGLIRLDGELANTAAVKHMITAAS
jgi:HK97 family phage major capsid protein